MTALLRLGLVLPSSAVITLTAAGTALAAQPPPPDPASSTANLSGLAQLSISVALLVFGIIVLLVLYAYLNAWRKNVVELAKQSFDKTGMFPTYQHMHGSVSVRGGDGFAAGADAGTLVIKGPAQTLVGRPSEPFVALLNENPVEASWSVDGNGELNPERDKSTTLIARSCESMKITADVKGDMATADVLAVNAPEVGKVPLLGVGYGGLTIAILAVSVAASLTAIGVLPGAALATLLGTVVSYFFLQKPSASGETTPRKDEDGSA